MPALYLVEFAIFALFIYGVITQIVMPLWRDTPLLPIFDREGKLEVKLREAKQDVLEAELEREIARQYEEESTIREERKETE